METLNNKKLSFPARFSKQVFAVLGMALLLSACEKDSGNVIVPPIYGLGCQNCQMVIPAPVPLAVFEAKGTDGTVVLSNMQLYGQSGGIQPNASGNNYKWYRGAVAVQGTMTVSTPQYDYNPGTQVPASSCVLLPGVYNLQTRLVGQMEDGGVNIVIPSLITTAGNIELRIDAPSPMGLLEEGRRLWANVSIVSVNGITCSKNFFGEFN